MIAVIIGTRPEIIKMAPIIRALGRKDFFILHTGQHYSYRMDGIFFRELALPAPKYNLAIGSATHGKQTGRMLEGIEEILLDEKPDVVLVQGDTNTVLAGALAATKLRIAVGHVEAGLRSHDMSMPEEKNRIVADHLSEMLFAPTKNAVKTLKKENVTGKIFLTGNTVVDAMKQHLNFIGDKEESDHFLVTVHREENTDDPSRLAGILKGLKEISGKYGKKIIYPMHPRTKKTIERYGLQKLLSSIETLEVTEPVSYLDFLSLENSASLVLTDSGGVQEEACILGVPCVTLRDNTERPETLNAGANVLAGTEPKKIARAAWKMLNLGRKWKNPFGDGKAGERIARIARSYPISQKGSRRYL